MNELLTGEPKLTVGPGWVEVIARELEHRLLGRQQGIGSSAACAMRLHAGELVSRAKREFGAAHSKSLYDTPS